MGTLLINELVQSTSPLSYIMYESPDRVSEDFNGKRTHKHKILNNIRSSKLRLNLSQNTIKPFKLPKLVSDLNNPNEFSESLTSAKLCVTYLRNKSL